MMVLKGAPYAKMTGQNRNQVAAWLRTEPVGTKLPGGGVLVEQPDGRRRIEYEPSEAELRRSKRS